MLGPVGSLGPAVSLPVHWTPEGLPVGVMLATATDFRLFLSVAWLGLILIFANRVYLRSAARQWQIVREGWTRVSTNMAEGYFSQLKRSIDGTHHHASDAHLPRYLARVRLPLYDPQGVGPRTVCDAHGASRRAPAHLSLNDRLVH